METDMTQDALSETRYIVVINHEEQYSIWPEYREIPAGWRSMGVSGGEQECLDYIEKNWTDMRPLSLRKFMQDTQTGSPSPSDN